MTKYLSIIFISSILFFAHAEQAHCSKPTIIVVYGPKGSGRANIAIRLQKDFLLPTISIASLVTTHLIEGTDLGKQARENEGRTGEIGYHIVLSALLERSIQPDCKNGFLFEDFPQTVQQFKELEKTFSPHFSFCAIFINAHDRWLVNRVKDRFVCRSCGRVYDDQKNPPEDNKMCTVCQTPLQQRNQDIPDVIIEQAKQYRSKIDPLICYLSQKRILFYIDGNRPIESIYSDVYTLIQSRKETTID